MDIEKILVSGLVISHRKLIIKQKKKRRRSQLHFNGRGRGWDNLGEWH